MKQETEKEQPFVNRNPILRSFESIKYLIFNSDLFRQRETTKLFSAFVRKIIQVYGISTRTCFEIKTTGEHFFGISVPQIKSFISIIQDTVIFFSFILIMGLCKNDVTAIKCFRDSE